MPSSESFHLIIPTHSAHDTLTFSVRSALNQTVRPERITIIGDGVTEAVRQIALDLSIKHPIVEFLDLPKSGNRGESYRDEVIRSSDADYISYLGDDDLLMPNHLEIMAAQLTAYDFVHPRPTFFRSNGSIKFLQSGIEKPRVRGWHSLNPPWNTISLTGATHSRKSYLALEKGWEAGPSDVWSDLFMWVKFLGNPGIRCFTVTETTTVKILYSKKQRQKLIRRAVIEAWYRVLTDQAAFAALSHEIVRKSRAFDSRRAIHEVSLLARRSTRQFLHRVSSK